MNEPLSNSQRWADFPDMVIGFRARRIQELEMMRIEYNTSDDFNYGWQIDHLLWLRPLAEALETRAAQSTALSSQGWCFDHCSLCTAPNQAPSSRYGVVCGPLSPNSFQIAESWHDYLRRSETNGELEVVRAGTRLLFEGNADDTADYIQCMVESWYKSGPPLP